MPEVPWDGKTLFTHDVTVTFYISFLVWLPYTCIMFYFYYEHRKRWVSYLFLGNIPLLTVKFGRNQHPQCSIILLLAGGCCLRCVWFYFASRYDNSYTMHLINRTAILFQFTAITLVLLMWGRSLNVSFEIDETRKRIQLERNKRLSSASASRPQGQGQGPQQHQSADHSLPESVPESDGSSYVLTREQENERNREPVDEEKLVRLAMAEYARKNAESVEKKTLYWYIFNSLVWLSVILCYIFSWFYPTLAFQRATAIMLTVLCVLVNVGIFFVGIQSYQRLRHELIPLYSQNAEGQYDKELSLTSLRGFSRFIAFIFRRRSTGFSHDCQLQEEILKTVLFVSFVVGFFFTVRSVLFIYRFFYVTEDASNYPYLLYPLWFYEFPEFFPNLLIAVGISPPYSFCRKCSFENIYLWCVESGCCCGCSHVSSAVKGGQRVRAKSVNKPNVYPLDLTLSSDSTYSDGGESVTTSIFSHAPGIEGSLSGGTSGSVVNPIVGSTVGGTALALVDDEEAGPCEVKDRFSFSIEKFHAHARTSTAHRMSTGANTDPRAVSSLSAPSLGSESSELTSDDDATTTSFASKPAVGDGYAAYMAGSTHSRFNPPKAAERPSESIRESFQNLFKPSTNNEWDKVEKYY